MSTTVLDRYRGKLPLPALTRSFLSLLEQSSYVLSLSEPKRKTIRVHRGGTNVGYVNDTVVGREGLVGYHFHGPSHNSDSCPPDAAPGLVEAFCDRFACTPATLDAWQDTSAKGSNSGRTFLHLLEPTTALRILSAEAETGAMESMTTIREQLRPHKLNRVRDLVAEAGIDVSSWFVDRNGEPIDNNVYRNFQWSFGGGGQPVALCIWHDEIDWDSVPPAQAGNTRSQQEELNALSDKATAPGVKSRLGIKVRRTRDFQNALYEAKSHGLAVRVILLDGQRTDIGDAADESSRVRARELDPIPWYVHECDPVTGSYRLVRGQTPPPILVKDPFEGIVDPGLDPAFQDFVATLGETEREAMIKARVGQGQFRQALIARWHGCAVTGCAAFDILVASHIKPWSKCLTPSERLGAANGLLLTPNFDKLFDAGLLTFDENYRIRVSSQLKSAAAIALHVDKNLKLSSKGVGKDLLPFFAWHGEEVFRP